MPHAPCKAQRAHARPAVETPGPGPDPDPDPHLEHDGRVEGGELDFVLGEQVHVQPLRRQQEEQRAATRERCTAHVVACRASGIMYVARRVLHGMHVVFYYRMLHLIVACCTSLLHAVPGRSRQRGRVPYGAPALFAQCAEEQRASRSARTQRTHARMHARTHAHRRAHTGMHTHAHTRAHTHAHARTHARTHARKHAHACTHAPACTHARAHTHARTRTHARTHTCTRTHTRAHASTRVHTHTRADMPALMVDSCGPSDAVDVLTRIAGRVVLHYPVDPRKVEPARHLRNERPLQRALLRCNVRVAT
jgi:hypothetical protein